MKQYLLPIRNQLPQNLNLEALVLSLIVLVLVKMLARWLTKKAANGCVELASPQDQSLDDHYYYHLGIVVLVIENATPNTFDACLWLHSFVFPGILRAQLRCLCQMQDLQLDAMNNGTNFQKLLTASRLAGILASFMAVGYGVFCWGFLFHASAPLFLQLLYPTWQLLLEATYVAIRSNRIFSRLDYFVSNNVEGNSPIDGLDIAKALAVSLLRTIHFVNLLDFFMVKQCTIMRLVESPWVVLLLWNVFTSGRDLLTKSMDYYNLKWLERTADTSLEKCTGDSKDVCTICHEDLLLCRKVSNCGHRFHYKCIFKWTFSRHNAECPVCRGRILQPQSTASYRILKQYE